MKEKEFKSLSEKRVKILSFAGKISAYGYPEKDIKEFIKRLKEKGYPTHFCGTEKCKCYNPKAKENNALCIELEEIDKLAGEKLVK